MTIPFISRKIVSLTGSVRVPGDKSISHRALMFGALAVGESTIHGLLEGEDVLRTASAMRALGAEITRDPSGVWHCWGRGVGGLIEPDDILDMGNSGTGARLLMGLVSSYPFSTFFTGDASLRSRPMRRVMDPLSQMGAQFFARDKGRLPAVVIGASSPLPITYQSPVASAQVKSAILLAGLNTPGMTTVIEREATRDHTELMLTGFGAQVTTEHLPGGGRRVSVTGYPHLTGQTVMVPADPSSAAFPLVAGLLSPQGSVRLEGVGMNPLRTGLLTTLQEMGANLVFEKVRTEAGEQIADIIVTPSALRGVDVPPERAPSMIDEYPILAIAAACASGTTRMLGVGELRVKESDRLGAMARGLTACGVRVEEDQDTLIVHGTGSAPKGGVTIAANLDHRIAMSFLVLGMVSQEPMKIDDASSIDTSFPGFKELMNGLGANIQQEE